MELKLPIEMIYSSLAKCAWHKLAIVKAIISLIKQEEDDMVEFWKCIHLSMAQVLYQKSADSFFSFCNYAIIASHQVNRCQKGFCYWELCHHPRGTFTEAST